MADEEEPPSNPDDQEKPLDGQPASSQVTDPARQIADLIQNFGLVLAPYSNFGVNGAPPDAVARDWLVKASGKLSPAEIEVTLRHFVPPDPYEHARAALHAEHVVVLEGDRGTGKFTAAVALLAERSDRLLVLPPSSSLRVLSGRQYDKNTGYVLEGSPDEGNAAEAGVTWRMIRDRVREAKAYLVVTSTVPSSGAARDAVCHIGWSPPSSRDVLHEYLPGRDDVIGKIAAEADADGYTMAELVDVARRAATGEPLDEVLGESDRVLAERVRVWFEKHRDDRPQIIEITALAFLAGARERTFETQLAQLADLFARALPEPLGAGAGAPPLPDGRVTRLEDEMGLVTRTDVRGLAASRTLTFKSPRYRRHVLAELSRMYTAQFWDPVQTWLEQIVGQGQGPLVAAGLAALARVDYGEVRDQYLEPWSRAEQGWQGQLTATYVLWMMCYDEQTLPLALPTATRWATYGNPAQRWTAAVALSGELGILYPAEAIERLWQLVIQDAEVRGDACTALAGLFASLVAARKNAGLVLTKMDRWRDYLDRQSRINKHVRDRTISAILEVFAVREVKGTHPALLRLLREDPQHAAVVGRLWAFAHRHIGFRMNAQSVLLTALTTLRRPNSGEPVADAEQVATTLAEGVADALTYTEMQQVKQGLIRLEARKRNKQDESFTSILLAALDRHLSRF